MNPTDIEGRVRLLARHGVNGTWLGCGIGESGIRMTISDGADEFGFPLHRRVDVTWAELLELVEP